jgi:transcriptional regulator with XRE-family HTH domain
VTSEPSPHYVDLHVGARLRLRRKAMGLSQSAVADAVGLTFQQLQKYERGANRISASKLHALAHVLTTSVSWFFDGLPDPVTPDSALNEEGQRASRVVQAFLMSSEGLELAQQWPTLRGPARRQILGLIRAMAEVDDAGEDAAA